jgi:hypothetical protein
MSQPDNKEYLTPDYDDHPREDDVLEDCIEEVTEEEIRLEKLLEDQERLAEKLADEQEVFRDGAWEPMTSTSPFQTTSQQSSSPGWGTSSSSAPKKNPWEKDEQKKWSPSSSGSGLGTGSLWSGGNRIWENKTNPSPPPGQVVSEKPRERKKAVIVDLLDCLYESWDSGGKPGVIPRAMFDLKPKFEAWDKVASFAPEKVYVIFPADEILPSLGDQMCIKATIEYIQRCLGTYFRLDAKRGICFLRQMKKWVGKERVIHSVVDDWKTVKEIVYIGTNTGRWGLSSRDIDAAHHEGIDYIDLYNLLDNKYIYE